MRSTLCHLPHADPFFDFPLFGFGWLLLIWMAVSGSLLVWQFAKHGWNEKSYGYLPLILIIGAVLYWVAPHLEEASGDGPPLGIPIRGYGVMLLLAIVCGTAFTVQQARRVGVESETIFSMAFWMIVSGFVGARLFFVIQKWEQFSRPTVRETLLEIVRFSEGGLVVYGSFFGACLGTAIFLKRRKLPALALCDLFAPGMMLGVALGRVGCLLNGCCWAGDCGDMPLGISFPPGSPPFMSQLTDGSLLDMRLEAKPEDGAWVVAQVTAGGRAEQHGIKIGDEVVAVIPPRAEELNRMRSGIPAPTASFTLELNDGRRLSWEFRQLPQRSRPVYPVQLLASINALLLCGFLWAFYPFRRRDGEVSALMITIYPVTRFLLEAIRVDEPDVGWTGCSIAQLLSILLVAMAVPLWWLLLKRPIGSALPAATGSPQ
ncbi:MAG: hypothetical protein FJ276_12475 [Planctomycetes bacterium]|nr:hypothetical protein [Planctomycetota bacterium]